MVCPLIGGRTGTFVALMSGSVLVPGMTLRFLVAAALAWEAMTAFGLTSSLMTKAASAGPVAKVLPIFMTRSLALLGCRTSAAYGVGSRT